MEDQSKNAAADAHGNDLKVLIVDDEVTLCEMLQDILQEYGYQTAYAENSESALQLMPSFKPTVALVDFRLGEVTGLEVARRLKEIDANLPVILMTAYATLDLAVKAIQNDIYDFISKPVDKTHLLRSLGKAAEKRKLIEENRQLIQSLKESNASLDRLNRMKSKFLSIVTHDLRVPLTSIRGYSDLLQTEANLSDAERVKCVAAIQKSAQRMGGLIMNLLDMVSIEAGKLRVETAPMDFAAICQELQATFAPVAESSKAALSWEVPQGPLKVQGDADRLVQVLGNLVSNALKHVPAQQGRIAVRVSLQDGPSGKLLLAEVVDNGEGISREDQAKIFERYYQVASSPTRREGVGLGLSIAKEVIQAHKGEIGVESAGPGKGSRFWFTVPLLPS